MLCAGLGVLIGHWKSRTLRGGVLGGLAGVPLAVIVVVALMSVDWGSRFSAPEVYRLQAYNQLVRALLHHGKHARRCRRTPRSVPPPFPMSRLSPTMRPASSPAVCPSPKRTPSSAHRNAPVIAQEYGRLAVQHLRHAIHLGYHDVNQMKAEPDLDPLRARQDFRELLAELGAPP